MSDSPDLVGKWVIAGFFGLGLLLVFGLIGLVVLVAFIHPR